jgi:formylglycine-generating enzyme required for sulfatase activity
MRFRLLQCLWPRPAVWVAPIPVILTAAVVGGFLWVHRPTPAIVVPQKGQDYTNFIGMKFKWIEPGSFLMGSPPNEPGWSNDETQHQVTLTKGFHMGVYPVTNGQFAAFAKDAGYQTEAEKAGDTETWRDPGFYKYTQTDDDPVVEVTHNDAVKFCGWLSMKEKRTYQLPTEAQWEYACRAGTPTAYSFGDDPKDLCDYAWCNDDAGGHTHPVGGKKSNKWGLYDMQGNVLQWCADAYGPYHSGDIKDPFNDKGDARVLRGESWNRFLGCCRSARRGWNAPGVRRYLIGCRVALRLD